MTRSPLFRRRMQAHVNVLLLAGSALSSTAAAATLDFSLVREEARSTPVRLTLRSGTGEVGTALVTTGPVKLPLPNRPDGTPLALSQWFGFLGTCRSDWGQQDRADALIPLDVTAASGDNASVVLPFALEQTGNPLTRVFPIFALQTMNLSGTLHCERPDKTTTFAVSVAFKAGWNLLRLTTQDASFGAVALDVVPLGTLKLIGRLP